MGLLVFFFFFFFQAEDGIRDLYVTGVQTCALPIWGNRRTVSAAIYRSQPPANEIYIVGPSRGNPTEGRADMRRISSCALISFLFFAAGRGPASSAADPEDQLRFNRDIRPILANACYQCHGPDPGGRKGKLRFDREEGFFGAREGGPTVVKGKPEVSPLFLRITSKDPEELMPPSKSHKVLKPVEKDLLRRWIA